MCSDASHIVQPIDNDGQDAVGSTAPFIHLGFSNRSVALPDLHDIQDILGAGDLDLQTRLVHMIASLICIALPHGSVTTLHMSHMGRMSPQLTSVTKYAASRSLGFELKLESYCILSRTHIDAQASGHATQCKVLIDT